MANKKAKGKRAKTRRKMRSRDRKTVNQLVQGFEEQEHVQICLDSSIHSGLPDTKYHGFSGKIVGKRGSAYEVEVKDGGILRVLVVNPAHLKGFGGEAS